MTETLANGYSFKSTHRELSNEYQHDRVLVLWTKVASAFEGSSEDRYQMILYPPYQGLSRDLENGKLAVAKLLGIKYFKWDHNILKF